MNLNNKKENKNTTTSNPKFHSEKAGMKHTHLPLQNPASLPPVVLAKEFCLVLSAARLLLTNTLQLVLRFLTLYLICDAKVGQVLLLSLS